MKFKIFFAFAFLASTSIINIHACEATKAPKRTHAAVASYKAAEIKAIVATAHALKATCAADSAAATARAASTRAAYANVDDFTRAYYDRVADDSTKREVNIAKNYVKAIHQALENLS